MEELDRKAVELRMLYRTVEDTLDIEGGIFTDIYYVFCN